MSEACPLVIVEWVDSSQPQASWSFLKDMPAPKAVQCVSVGWLVHRSEEVICLAPNMGDIRSELESAQTSGNMTIPTRCVLKITCLGETSSLDDFPLFRLAKEQTQLTA